MPASSGAVTIATNMAGRGTDIQLGGNVDMRVEDVLNADAEADPEEVRQRMEAEVAGEKEKVKGVGGLFVLATERHESRRIDNQLRGRSGRQGDPGRSSFFLSLEGRSDAHLRIGAVGQDAVHARHERGRGHRSSVGSTNRSKRRRPRSRGVISTSASNC